MKKLLLSLFILLTIQLQAQCWKEIGLGESHSAAIANNGTLWTWGVGTQGQLGFATNNFFYTPVQVGIANDWKKVGSGRWYNLLQKNDGTLWACGHAGPMLIHSESNKRLYQINTDTDWKTFSCGPHFAMLIKNDGTLWAWGDNSFGQTGTGPTNNAEPYPTQIGIDTWKSVSAGYEHSVGVKSDGTLWMWGKMNTNSEINGVSTIIPTPVQIGTDTDWKIAAAGQYISAAIKTDGSLWTWGINTMGQLGIGTQIDEPNPVQVGTDTWEHIEAGYISMHGTKTDGTLWGWGFNRGQIGNGELAVNILTPILVFEQTGWRSVSDYQFTAFINDNGSIKTCGNNGPHLGIGQIPNTFVVSTPTTVICNTASLNENTLSYISIYPNPTANTLNISNTGNINIENLKVIDVTGKILLEQKSNTSQLDVQQLPAGIYFLEITANSTKQYNKFIKK